MHNMLGDWVMASFCATNPHFTSQKPLAPPAVPPHTTPTSQVAFGPMGETSPFGPPVVPMERDGAAEA